MADKKRKRSGVSFMPEDAIETGLFPAGPATIVGSLYSKYTYGGSTAPQLVWLVTFAREGEENYDQPYSLGKGWKASPDGMELIPLNSQKGLPKNCNAMKYLITPLVEALRAADKDPEDFLTGDPSLIEGLSVVVDRVAQEKRNIKSNAKKKDGKDGADEKERTILIVSEVNDEEPVKGKGKKKAKPVDDEDEDEEDADDDDDDDEDEKPKAKAKKKPAAKDDDDDDDDADDDDDDDADEPPAKSKSKDKGKGKAKAATSDIDEEATEALVSALEANDNDPIKMRALDGLLNDALKGNPQRKAIIAHATDPDFLETEVSWSYDGKTVSEK